MCGYVWIHVFCLNILIEVHTLLVVQTHTVMRLEGMRHTFHACLKCALLFIATLSSFFSYFRSFVFTHYNSTIDNYKQKYVNMITIIIIT